MGAANSFNDARVLRSQENTLTLSDLRWLLLNLEGQPNTIKDLQNLQQIADKIDEALGSFGEECERLIAAARREAKANATDRDEVARIDNELSLKLMELDDTDGAEEAPDVMLKPSQIDWIKDRLDAGKSFAGSRQSRARILRIKEVLDNSLGVKFIGKDKKAWIEGDPEPEPEALPVAAATAANGAVATKELVDA